VLVQFRDPEGPGGRTKQLRPHSEIEIKCLEKEKIERTRDDGEGEKGGRSEALPEVVLVRTTFGVLPRILADAGSNITYSQIAACGLVRMHGAFVIPNPNFLKGFRRAQGPLPSFNQQNSFTGVIYCRRQGIDNTYLLCYMTQDQRH
jgi:hypothetical protein